MAGEGHFLDADERMARYRNRRGKLVEIPEKFREKGKPKKYGGSPPRKGRLPEVTREREMARAPRIDEDWG